MISYDFCGGRALRIAIGIMALVLVMAGGVGATKIINANATGGDCASFGTWSVVTKTCTMTSDLTETIQIDSNGITLDGNGYTNSGSNTGNGVYLSGMTGVTIKNLNVKHFYTGIYLVSSNNNTLSNNTGYGDRGIVLRDSSNNNTLIGNNTSNNNYCGIDIQGTNINTIYNNYFSNTNNACNVGNNIWSINKTSGTNIINGAFFGGNFWANPGFVQTFTDANRDGICDSKYTLDGNNADYLPLTYPPQKTYNVSGYVSDNNGSGLECVLVKNGSYQNLTIVSGYYSISGLPKGTYNFSFNKTGFHTGYLEVIIIGADTTNKNKTLYDTTPSAISAISSSNITSTSATIFWTTNEASDTQVEYGTTTSYGNSTSLNTNLVTSHSQSLSDLTSSILYHYRVKSKDAAGNLATSADQTFTTSASATGLIAFWKFDENTGTTAADSSGNGNNGIISGATWVAGEAGNALSFDDVNDYVNGGNINIINAITIEAWVKPNVITGKSRIIARKSSAYYFQINDNGRLEVYLYGTSNPGYHRMTSIIPLNTWTHVAVTYNGSKVLLYQNGTSQSFNDTGSLVLNSNSVRIGSESGTSRQFSGLIDEVRIYNRSLSASEILADAGLSDTTPNNEFGSVWIPEERFSGVYAFGTSDCERVDHYIKIATNDYLNESQRIWARKTAENLVWKGYKLFSAEKFMRRFCSNLTFKET